MPRQVDRNARIREITDIAVDLLAERGPSALTIRGLADQMEGSITLITHYYPNRKALIDGITTQLFKDYEIELEQLEVGRSSTERLRILLEWMIPLIEHDKARERGRVMMVGERSVDPSVEGFFTAMENKMRSLLRSHLEPVVPAEDVEMYVDLLRVLTNGIILSAVEHPQMWTPQRQLRALEFAIASLGIDG